MTLDPIVRSPLPVLLEHPWLPDGAAIIERALEDDVAQTFDYRAMRIALTVGERVVLAMAGHPFLGHDGRRAPEPQPHWERGKIVQSNTAVRLRPMEEHRDAHVRELARYDDKQHGHPPSRRPEAKACHCQLHRS